MSSSLQELIDLKKDIEKDFKVRFLYKFIIILGRRQNYQNIKKIIRTKSCCS